MGLWQLVHLRVPLYRYIGVPMLLVAIKLLWGQRGGHALSRQYFPPAGLLGFQ